MPGSAARRGGLAPSLYERLRGTRLHEPAMSRPSLPALRRLAVATVAAAGLALVGASVSGIAQIDDTLADAGRQQAPARYERVSLERRSAADCPRPRHERPSPALAY